MMMIINNIDDNYFDDDDDCDDCDDNDNNDNIVGTQVTILHSRAWLLSWIIGTYADVYLFDDVDDNDKC